MVKEEEDGIMLGQVTVNGVPITIKEDYRTDDSKYSKYSDIPSHVDVETVIESSVSHDWDKNPVVGEKITCKRCWYSIRVQNDNPDMEFLDYAVPCDQVVMESVMED